MTTHDEIPISAQSNHDARVAGIVLVVVPLLSILMMAHHPSAGSHDPAALVAEIAEKSRLSRIVHGVLIALMGAELFAFIAFCRQLGFERSAVRAGFVAYSIGTGAMIGAALISGFIISDLAAHYVQQPSGDALAFVDLSRLAMIGNQALAKLGVVAMSAAIVLWSAALFHSGRDRWVGIAGFLAGLGPAIALVIGAVRLDVGGMTLVVVCQAAWIVMVGIQMIRARI
jgi:hypothetical protein